MIPVTWDPALASVLARSDEAYRLGLDGWHPRFVATHRDGKGSPVYACEPWGRGEWASFRLGQYHRERELDRIRNFPKRAP